MWKNKQFENDEYDITKPRLPKKQHHIDMYNTEKLSELVQV